MALDRACALYSQGPAKTVTQRMMSFQMRPRKSLNMLVYRSPCSHENILSKLVSGKICQRRHSLVGVSCVAADMCVPARRPLAMAQKATACMSLRRDQDQPTMSRRKRRMSAASARDRRSPSRLASRGHDPPSRQLSSMASARDAGLCGHRTRASMGVIDFAATRPRSRDYSAGTCRRRLPSGSESSSLARMRT